MPNLAKIKKERQKMISELISELGDLEGEE
jgi:hypothetical protein